jgi:hypothetical protein
MMCAGAGGGGLLLRLRAERIDTGYWLSTGSFAQEGKILAGEDQWIRLPIDDRPEISVSIVPDVPDSLLVLGFKIMLT